MPMLGVIEDNNSQLPSFAEMAHLRDVGCGGAGQHAKLVVEELAQDKHFASSGGHLHDFLSEVWGSHPSIIRFNPIIKMNEFIRNYAL